MEPWNERVTNSTALMQANAIKSSLSGLDQSLVTNVTKDYVERLELIVDTVIDRLTNTDPRLVNVAGLNNLGNSLTTVNSYLSNWIQGAGETWLTTNIEAELETVVAYLITIAPGQDTPAAREALTSLRRSVGRNKTIVDQVTEQVVQQGAGAGATIDEKVAGVTQEFIALKQKITNLDSEIQTIKVASTQVTTEQQMAFTKAEADRSTAFNKLVTDKQKELDASLDDLKQGAATAVEAIRNNVEADEKAAATARARVEEILSIVGEESLVGDYSKNAREERTSANTWRWITAVSLLAAIAVALMLATNVTDTTAWQHVAAKSVVVVSFGGLAGYAARQSSEHRSAQREAERMALQLKALKPYLSDIDDVALRDDLLAKIADRLFGQKEQVPALLNKQKKDKGENPVLLNQLLEAIIELAKQGK